MRKLLDTNILLRYIIGDVDRQYELVRELLYQANESDIRFLILPETLIEMSYVLKNNYGISKEIILQTTESILHSGVIELLTNYELDFSSVLNFHSQTSLSLEDCLFLQTCLNNNLELVTFDKHLEKIFQLAKNNHA
jgi:predicted nucleic acid-binding protein